MLIFGSRGRNQGSQRIEESMATVPAGSPSPSALLYPSTFHTVLTPLSYVACSSRVLRVLSHCRWHYDLISFGVFEVVRRACITATSLHYAVARGGNWTGAPSPNSLISLPKPKQYRPLLHLSPRSAFGNHGFGTASTEAGTKRVTIRTAARGRDGLDKCIGRWVFGTPIP